MPYKYMLSQILLYKCTVKYTIANCNIYEIEHERGTVSFVGNLEILKNVMERICDVSKLIKFLV